MTPTEHNFFDVAVVGGGATGYAAALASVEAGFRTILFAPRASFPAGRTAALLHGSIEILSGLGVWPMSPGLAAPLRAIRIIDATRRLIRAPEITFHASEIGLPAFGFNIANGDLVEALRSHALSNSDLTIADASVEAVHPDTDKVALSAGGSTYGALLVVAADGARSVAREAAGISVRSWTHRQSAMVATFEVERPHGDVSTEFHTENGPFTLVPLPEQRMSLVWMDRPERTEARARLNETELSRAVEEQAHWIYGAMQLDSSPATFPLRAALADRFAGNRTVLVGEAAHLFPPIGAQGLNLGFRDVAALKRTLGRCRGDPGAAAAIEGYHASRQADVRSRSLAVDLLNRSLLTDFLPVQAARGIGLALASSVPVLRRALMRQGLARGASELPR